MRLEQPSSHFLIGCKTDLDHVSYLSNARVLLFISFRPFNFGLKWSIQNCSLIRCFVGLHCSTNEKFNSDEDFNDLQKTYNGLLGDLVCLLKHL